MHPFTASISLFTHPGILYSLWAADMQTKSQQSMAFGATWSNPIIWGRSRATSVPAWCGEKEEERMGQLWLAGFVTRVRGEVILPKWALWYPWHVGSHSSGLSVKSLFPAWIAGWMLSREQLSLGGRSLLSLGFSCLHPHAQRGSWMWQQCKEGRDK